jgi:hypothetical protein
LPTITEPVVFDHFETFVARQEEALGLATSVGQRSWFIFGVDPAPHRRGGKRTPAQLMKLRVKPVRVPSGAVQKSTARTLDLLMSKVPADKRLQLVSDGHASYGRAIAAHHDRDRVEHRTYPNPRRGAKGSRRGRRARVRDRQMRAVDVLHGLLRHSCAHHRRETIAFGRRTHAVMERGLLTVVWRNFVKKVTGDWERVLARRLFPHRVRLPSGWMAVYRREWITESIGANTLHRLRYAY